MPSEPRTIRGPCFDCNDPGDFSCWCGWGDTDICACHSPLGERTAPIPKLDPETRPNVPPRMM
jgi:hypothetical protein